VNLTIPTTAISHVASNSDLVDAPGSSASDSPEVKKLKKGASDFEAMLISKWWSSMKESGLGGDDDSDPGHDTLDAMSAQAIGTALASHGGLGIAKLLVSSLLDKAEEGGSAMPTDGIRKP
jgi:Rod binding domain-containing protein